MRLVERPLFARLLGLRVGECGRVVAGTHDDLSHVVVSDMTAFEAGAPHGDLVDEFNVVTDDDTDASPSWCWKRGRHGCRRVGITGLPSEIKHGPCDGVACRRVDVVGRLVEDQYVRLQGECARDLQSFAFAARERVVPVWPVVCDAERVADCYGFRTPVAGKIIQIGRFDGDILRTEGDNRVGRADLPVFRCERAACDVHERGFADAVVAEHGGPAGCERDSSVFENRFRRPGVRVGDM